MLLCRLGATTEKIFNQSISLDVTKVKSKGAAGTYILQKFPNVNFWCNVVINRFVIFVLFLYLQMLNRHKNVEPQYIPYLTRNYTRYVEMFILVDFEIVSKHRLDTFISVNFTSYSLNVLVSYSCQKLCSASFYTRHHGDHKTSDTQQMNMHKCCKY